MDSKQQVRYAYLLSAVGVVLMAITSIYSFVRALLFRPTFDRGGFNQSFNSTLRMQGGFNGAAGGARFAFGLVNDVTALAVLLAIVGIIWLGLALKQSQKS